MDAKALNETPIQKLEREYRELHPRSTPTQAYRELAMAYATKQPRHGEEEIELGQAATGDLKGQLYVKSLKLVRGESEDWPQFIGRIEQTAAKVAETLTKHNAGKIERDLKAVKS